MNTLNYIGCKNKLFNNIYSILQDNIPDIKEKTFSDLFMGTGIVSYNMLEKCKSIHANDLETYSFYIGNAILKCNYSTKLENIIEDCNNLPEIEGLIYKNYSPNESCDRMFFTNENAKKGDAIRTYINQLLDSKKINTNEFYFLVASLIVSIDKVANTTCVYGAYLKTFKESSKKKLVLNPIHKNTVIKTQNNIVTNDFAEKIDYKSDTFDITYLDPPYNHRAYSSNYFVLNFIANYDPLIIPRGKTGLFDKNQSDFSKKSKVKEAFINLINNVKSKYIILSYNNEGLLSEEELKDILLKKGKIKLYKIKYNKFKSQKNVKGDFVYEYIWFIDIY
jgi:adenine-specific DNA-methyltransferase